MTRERVSTTANDLYATSLHANAYVWAAGRRRSVWLVSGADWLTGGRTCYHVTPRRLLGTVLGERIHQIMHWMIRNGRGSGLEPDGQLFVAINTFGQGPKTSLSEHHPAPMWRFGASGLLRYSYLLTYLFKAARRMSKDIYILPLCVFDTQTLSYHMTEWRLDTAILARYKFLSMYVKSIAEVWS